MIAVDVEDLAALTDFVVLTNIQFAIEDGLSFRHKVVELKNLDLTEMKAGETLYLAGHGSAGILNHSGTPSINFGGEVGLSEIFRRAAKGRADLPKIRGVIITSCHSAHADQVFNIPSLVRGVASTLTDLGLPLCWVKGYRGPAISSPYTAPTRVITSQGDGDITNRLKAKHDIEQKVERYLASAQGNIYQKARHVADLTKDFYIEFIKELEKAGRLYAKNDGACLENRISMLPIYQLNNVKGGGRGAGVVTTPPWKGPTFK
jgi:hypothetical protein